MISTKEDKLEGDIAGWCSKYGGNRDALLPVLQEIHKQYGIVSDSAMQVSADLLGIHPAEVYGVVSFYHFLNYDVKGTFTIRLCRTLSCDMAGKSQVARQLKNDLGIEFGETTSDGMFSLEWANCLGMCDRGPAMLVNDQVFTEITPVKVHAIIEGCRRNFSAYSATIEEAYQPWYPRY